MSASGSEQTSIDFVVAEIKRTLISKKELRKSQDEVLSLKNQLKRAEECLNESRREYEREKLQKEIIIAEKKVVESKFDEIALKLKLKNQQYDDLLKSKNTVGENAKVSIGTQTIKIEPNEIGVVNVPISTPSTTSSAAVRTMAAKAGTKRKQSVLTDYKLRRPKRNTGSNDCGTMDSNSKPEQTYKRYTCFHCFDSWGKDVKQNTCMPIRETTFESWHPQLRYDVEKGPDPKLSIRTFTDYYGYHNHIKNDHAESNSSKLSNNFHMSRCSIPFKNPVGDLELNYTPTGKKICEICYVRFKQPNRLQKHLEIEHANLSVLTKNELFGIWFKYDEMLTL